MIEVRIWWCDWGKVVGEERRIDTRGSWRRSIDVCGGCLERRESWGG